MDTGNSSTMEDGHYYRDQIGSSNPVIAWSHRSRFEKAISLIDRDDCKLLDYGCGDGTFLATAAGRIGEGHGSDVDADQIEGCRERFADLSNVSFSVVGDLGEDQNGTFDVVTCMETLEHCTEPIVEIVLADVARLCSRDGRAIISVPIEIGPSFLLKQSIRALAARMGNSSYHMSERYSARDAAKMVFAGRDTVVERPLYKVDGAEGYSHFGFNWRWLRGRVAHHLEIEQTQFTPMGQLGGVVSSQAWFLCRPKG
jgi:2-polyprenyl-3-methyl-5-hydroxy-6-metoxy-1,4-benzoquinol methylase